MLKPEKLKKGDTIALVSLSSGLFGDAENEARLKRTLKNVEELLDVKIKVMPHALAGSKQLYEHPEWRAEDLMTAFQNHDVKAIITFTGGCDTIRLLPYIDFNVIKENPKIFMGFSDTTVNHFMMYKAGLISYYGPAAGVEFSLPNVNQENIQTVINTLFEPQANLSLSAYNIIANDPKDWSTCLLDIQDNPLGYEVINGCGQVTGKLLGGCIDVFPMMIGTPLWPDLNEWQDKILFFETSDEEMEPKNLKYILYNLGVQGIFSKIKGIIVGRPKNGHYYKEYNQELLEVLRIFNCADLPVIANCHLGHSWLWHILPLGVEATIDCEQKMITLNEKTCKDD